MVKRHSFMKLCVRSVRQTATRFISILAIVTVGCGFLAGLTATKPDMLATADAYYDENKTYDLNIKGTWGLNVDDAEQLSAMDGVSDVLMCHSTDAVMNTEAGSCTVRIFDTLGTEERMNGFELLDGRYPENASECLIIVPNKYGTGHGTGDVFTLSEDDPDYDRLTEDFDIGKLTAVGVARSPSYMSMESELSTKGSGSVTVIMYVMPECAKTDYYTDAFVTLSGAAELNSFSDEYLSLTEEGENRAADLGAERCDARYAEEYGKASGKLEDARREYNDAKRDAEEKLAEAEAELDSAEVSLDRAEAELDENEASLSAMSAVMTQEQYAAAAAQLQAGRESVREGRAELYEKRADYEREKSEAEAELEDAAADIADGERELSELEKPEWVITPRSESTGYYSYEGNCEKMAAIAKVFPVFFFLVAALVALTTMTRMVDEDRGQAGTLKALGFSDGRIISYYLLYAAVAGVIGSIAGCFIGFFTLPAVISNAYGMMYDLPPTIQTVYPGTMLFICSVSVLCIVAAAFAACAAQMRACPAELIRPRAPKAGKRILLEYIKPFWKRLNFTGKVTARNIFRYKKRLYMTVLGIAGCMALLVTAFGLRDSIHNIVDLQFGELYKYNLTVYLSGDHGGAEELLDSLIADGEAERGTFVHLEKGSGTSADGEESIAVNICVPQNTEALKDDIILRRRADGSDIPFEENSAVFTEKMCENLRVGEGDTVMLEDADGNKASVTVSGIAENYITSYVFLSRSVYENAFGADPEMNAAYVTYAGTGDEEALVNKLLEDDNVAAVNSAATVRESFENTVQSIDYIVIVLIVAAGVLAVIVTYSLTNINICERMKELATLKVLGFFDGETAAYIYKETGALCLMGTALGCLLGKLLHIFVIRTAEVDSLMFGRSVSPVSFLLAAAITLIFTLVVDAVMLPKIRKIDMVESMKSTE